MKDKGGYMSTDILFYDNTIDNYDGDLKIEDNDLKLGRDKDIDKQESIIRLNTSNPDWYNHYLLGADLEDLRGMDQKPETAETGKRKIIQAFTHDNRFNRSDLHIDAIPTNVDEITFFIFINKNTNDEILIEHTVPL